jgi:hypothetical protein
MTDEDIRKLLGGYATDTLSEEEQKALFEAALHDEKLFAALADEHALREMLNDPGHRAGVLRALRPAPSGWKRWMMPVGVAASLVVIASVVYVSQRPPVRIAVETAKVTVPPAAPEIRREAAATAPSTSAARAPVAAPERRKTVDRAEPLREKPVGKEESKANASNAQAVVSALPDPVAAAAPPSPPPSEVRLPSRAPSSESVEVQASTPQLSADVAISTGARLIPVRTMKGMVNSAGKVQYTILKRGPDGQFKPVDAGSTFQPADAVRLNVEAEESGFLAVSQTEPAKILFQGVVRKQVPVTVPATGSLDLSNRGPFQIMFRQPGFAGGAQINLLPRQQVGPGSLSKKKAMTEADSQKSVARQTGSKDQAAESDGTITVDVNLNVATPAQQQK